MARFILVENGEKVIRGINTEEVKEFYFEKGFSTPVLQVVMREDGGINYKYFDTDEEALDFINKNFILFNK